MPLLKQSDCLVFFPHEGTLHCRNYLTGIEVILEPVLVAVLQGMNHWRTPQQVERQLEAYSRQSVRRTLRDFEKNTLVVKRGSAQERKEAALAPWKAWGVEARFLHFGTKDVFSGKYPVRGGPQDNRALLRESPQPPFVKRYAGASRVALPEPRPLRGSEFAQVLLRRRTHRRFSRGPISREEMATLLKLTWGITGTLPCAGLGRVPVRTSPSGGARQVIEVYLLVLRVMGLPRGLYHYCADRHRLELLRRGASAAQAVKFCGGQKWAGGCAALFLMTGVFPRMMWRYKFSRAYRVVLLEAGHFCQTFCLTATWLGLGPFCTAATHDVAIEEALGLDGAKESVLYVAGVGKLKD